MLDDVENLKIVLLIEAFFAMKCKSDSILYIKKHVIVFLDSKEQNILNKT